MKLTQKYEKWNNFYYVGNFKKHLVTISLCSSYSEKDKWYFLIKDKVSNCYFNSLWEGKRFLTKEEASLESQKYILKKLSNEN